MANNKSVDISIPIIKYKRVGSIVLLRVFGILVYRRVGPKYRIFGMVVYTDKLWNRRDGKPPTSPRPNKL